MDLKNLIKRFNIFLDKGEKITNNKNIEKTSLFLYNRLINDSYFKSLSKKERINVFKHVFDNDALDILEKNGCKIDRNWKDIFYNSLGMNENWTSKRNLLGLIMVELPEVPTYFIPSYVQSKTNGDAKDLKKGEGPRGLIAGALEGLAVGALVSGKKREMVPYIALGMGLQMISSAIFPWLGEKVGKNIYNKNLAKKVQLAENLTISNQITTIGEKTSFKKSQKNLYSNQQTFNYSGSLKI